MKKSNNYISAATAIYLLKKSAENKFYQGEGPFKKKVYRIIEQGEPTIIHKLNPKQAQLVKDFIKTQSK